MSGAERGCSFCGTKPASYVELGLYVCDSSQCDLELQRELRGRDEQAREDAAADDYSRYR